MVGREKRRRKCGSSTKKCNRQNRVIDKFVDYTNFLINRID